MPRAGSGASGPALQPFDTEQMPRVELPDPTQRVFGFVGSTTTALIPRCLNALPVYGPEIAVVVSAGRSVHVLPPSVDLYRPRPASLSADEFCSPVPAYSVSLFAS